ncbi:PREDICTED: receptor-like protein kinase HSL1 [Ipomoea nil]|uniref:receptor-like protein kinase HSL1 n=1 Tax=Ipomoea nil TaxID=35883 RepID=UPI000901438C|nr:PREDICTED: receptor-like protein kinase HSL1 [Ipomoea nil]
MPSLFPIYIFLLFLSLQQLNHHNFFPPFSSSRDQKKTNKKMALHRIAILLLLLLYSVSGSYQARLDDQSEFFTAMKKSFTGSLMGRWDGEAVCEYRGVVCDDKDYVVKIDVSGWSISGEFPGDVCSYLPKLRVLRVGHNKFHGGFPGSLTSCSFLEELNMTATNLTGSLPDLSPLQALRALDLSYNLFTGEFPMSFTNLTNLEVLVFNENGGFNPWELPGAISGLKKLKSLILTTCMLRGRIPGEIGNMTSLVDLELSGNSLVGRIPGELGRLKNLELLELYYNQLEGEIPEELGNLTQLRDFDVSVNRLTGKIPDSVCLLPNLEVLQVYNNTLSGGFPAALANSTTLRILSLYTNYLSGEVPQSFGESSALEALDLSENQFSGKLPPKLCLGGKLIYILLLQNKFSGELPESYGRCQTLVRFRVSNNLLEGKIPEGIFGLPHASIIDVSYNRLNGSIPRTIGSAKNLSELFIQGNSISGILPSEITEAINLVKVDLSSNFLSGPIPSEIGNLKRLNVLLLQGNEFTASIPGSLSSLKSLNYLDLSSNLLTGSIPESLGELLPNSMNFSNNMLSGVIPISFIMGGVLESFSGNPGLCVPGYLNSSDSSFPLCSESCDGNKKVNLIWVVGISVGIVVVGIVLFLKRWCSQQREITVHEDSLSSSVFSYDLKSFHRLSFEQREIFEGLVEKNIVGYGGSGTVYKVELGNGEAIAVKKLWSRKGKDPVSDNDEIVIDKELKTEVETLGSIRHKNIVKLYCYFSSLDCNLLVYEYMPNGNLWDALHKGKMVLDWPTRYQVCLGIAQGLAYLHHDLLRPIIHRDIKSTNILLDVDYHPKVADFGIAKVLQARGGGKDSTTTVIAGTYGYLAPEYAYSSKATTKCDVYSFGVVLLEVITGKKPVEAEFGENKNIVYWVSTKVETKEEAYEALDKRVSGWFKEDMMKVLRIAIRCTCRTPALRPTMNEVVQQLIEADPCRFDCCKLSGASNKTKEKDNVMMMKPN